jgi:hypothetical protein
MVISVSIGCEKAVSVLAYEVWRFVIFLPNYKLLSFINSIGDGRCCAGTLIEHNSGVRSCHHLILTKAIFSI